MIQFTTYDLNTGRILSTKQVRSVEEVALNTPTGQGCVPAHYESKDHYVVDGAAMPRPTISPMTGATYDLSTLPTGAKLIITDPVKHETEVAAQNDTLKLVDAGAYRVRSASPFPWIDFDTTVEVSV
ncbi:MAG: hypothetical protein KDK02_15990 [Rhodobacteraceae bacterium]|nr:hypothetical protein [Paracoccaceae bacterium]